MQIFLAENQADFQQIMLVYFLIYLLQSLFPYLNYLTDFKKSNSTFWQRKLFITNSLVLTIRECETYRYELEMNESKA